MLACDVSCLQVTFHACRVRFMLAGDVSCLQVTFHMEHSFLISTAISRLQGLTSSLRAVKPDYRVHVTGYERALGDLVTMVSVFAPLFGAELRQAIGKPPVAVSAFPLAIVGNMWHVFPCNRFIACVAYDKYPHSLFCSSAIMKVYFCVSVSLELYAFFITTSTKIIPPSSLLSEQCYSFPVPDYVTKTYSLQNVFIAKTSVYLDS